MANLYKRGDVYWFRQTIAGVEYRESLRTTDARAAKKARDRRVEEIKSSTYHGGSKITWQSAVVQWADYASDQISERTMCRYLCSLEIAGKSFDTLLISQITGDRIVEFIENRKKEVSAATIRRDLTAVSQVLQFADFKGWVDGNPTLTKRRHLKERRDPIVLPTHEAIEEIISQSSAIFGALIRAAWLTGCRQNELVTAQWQNFSAEAQTLSVIGKGNKRRTIKLAGEAVELISRLPRVLGSKLIFCHSDGLQMAQAASNFTGIRRGAIQKAKGRGEDLQRFRFHDLRHLYAVEALRGGMSVYDLSQHMGHTSVKTTEIYLEFLTVEEKKAAKDGTKDGTAAINK
jgi:integrase/recombinase XerD